MLGTSCAILDKGRPIGRRCALIKDRIGQLMVGAYMGVLPDGAKNVPSYRRKLESSSLWVQGLFKGNAMRLNTRAQLWAGDLGPAKPSKPAVAMIEVLRVLRVRVT